jgi:hypothetical protein
MTSTTPNKHSIHHRASLNRNRVTAAKGGIKEKTRAAATQRQKIVKRKLAHFLERAINHTSTTQNTMSATQTTAF